MILLLTSIIRKITLLYSEKGNKWENEKLERFMFPRVLAVAQTAWSEKLFEFDGFVDEIEYITKLISDKGVVFENTSEWGYSKFATARGWLKFVNEHYTPKKAETDY